MKKVFFEKRSFHGLRVILGGQENNDNGGGSGEEI